MAEAVTIERLRADSPHVAMVAEWTHAAWGHLNPGMTLNDAIERLRGECGAGGVPSVFVAMCDDVPVGTASLVVDDMSDRPDLSPWLASVFVPPEWRGRGIASSLVQRVEAEAREAGIAVFHLYTPDQQALYGRLGWEAVEERDYRGEAVTIMRRRFDADTA
ncbi:Acetyltransferase (GNAT) family protein [Franzmannia pantelleriensis]|uniref:Acetyltransferase (GNAT) family protein n=1 Tax=Franzmannia pantelleriensis TaxID=48727 RepID=A0A1G9I1D6_9GAMM|nr:GNAT family N-acetyltransferase [Halomonas pantelleriensis]SDL19057.1 Acetyltransferase (GNAT) family protein [Halomonas pantelleriensis]